MSCDPGYHEQIRVVSRFSSDRAALFEALAARGWGGDRCEKLRVLQRLEIETVALLGSILECARAVNVGSANGKTRSATRGLAGRRWIVVIEALAGELARRVAQVEALERLAPTQDAPLLAQVTAHHVALQMFLRLEVSGRGKESMLPALALLPTDPLPLAAAAG